MSLVDRPLEIPPLSRSPLVRSAALFALLAVLAGACTVDDAPGGNQGGNDTGVRPDLPSMIDVGQDDTSEGDADDATSQPDGSLDSDWEPAELELRTREEVCGRWVADRALRQPNAWSSGGGGCAPGTLHEEAASDALRYTNLYRWLVGLPPVVEDPEFSRKAQLCAVIMRALGDIQHVVPETAACWTEDGSEAAQSSNLALGPTHPAPAIDLYMIDTGVPSLGHRRWLISPEYERAGFGLVDRYSCHWVFSFGGRASTPYMPFPNPGFAPLTERPVWSVTFGTSTGFDAATFIRVFDVETGEEMEVSRYTPERGFGPDTLAFTPQGWSFEKTYEVRVENARQNGQRVDLVYRTTPTRCQ
jgi:uncharacterized protein YkwD